MIQSMIELDVIEALQKMVKDLQEENNRLKEQNNALRLIVADAQTDDLHLRVIPTGMDEGEEVTERGLRL